MRDEPTTTATDAPGSVVAAIVDHARQMQDVVARLGRTDTLYELTDEPTVRAQTQRNLDELDALLDAVRATLHEEVAGTDVPAELATQRVAPEMEEGPAEFQEGEQREAEVEGTAASDDVEDESSAEPQTPRPTPAAMVGTSPPKTPRPPRSSATMTMSSGAEQMVVSQQISTLDLELIIAEPTTQWLGENPLSPDKPTVAVREDHYWGVIYYMIGEQEPIPHVISVKPRYVLYRERRELTAGFRKSGAGASTEGQKRPAIDSLDAFVKRAEAAGLEYTPGRKHGKISKPGTTVAVTIPNTPSDTRAWNNSLSTVRRVLNVDL